MPNGREYLMVTGRPQPIFMQQLSQQNIPSTTSLQHHHHHHHQQEQQQHHHHQQQQQQKQQQQHHSMVADARSVDAVK